MDEIELTEKLHELLILAQTNQLPPDSLRRWAGEQNVPASPCGTQIGELLQVISAARSQDWTSLSSLMSQVEGLNIVASVDTELRVLRNEDDVEEFLTRTRWFHDSYIQSVRYESMARLQPDRSVWLAADNYSAVSRIHFRQQVAGMNSFELCLVGIDAIHLRPREDCMIYNAEIVFRGGLTCWVDNASEGDPNTWNDRTWFEARTMAWRRVPTVDRSIQARAGSGARKFPSTLRE